MGFWVIICCENWLNLLVVLCFGAKEQGFIYYEKDAKGMDPDTRINEAFEQCYNSLFSYCFSSLEGDEQSAMDAVDTVFMIAKSKADGLDEIKDIKKWLFAIAKNAVRNIRRKQRRYAHRFILFDPATIDPENYTDGTSIRWWMDRAFSLQQAEEMKFDGREMTDEEIDALKSKLLQTLSDDERALFCLRYDEGVTTKELVERYGKTPDAIRMRLSRISMKLTERIKIYFENERSF